MDSVVFSFRLVLGVSSLSLCLGLGAGCAEHLPEVVPLTPAGEQVEVVSEPPNADIYQPIGAVTTRVAGKDADSAKREAKNELRNQTARKGGSMVQIEELSTNNTLMSRGHTVVSMTGTAFKEK